MADIADIANDYAQVMLDRSISAQLRPVTTISRDDCIECGEDIPAARQIAVPGVQCCRDCQDLIDLRSKGVRRV